MSWKRGDNKMRDPKEDALVSESEKSEPFDPASDALDARLRAHYARERPDPRTVHQLVAASTGAGAGAGVRRTRRRRMLAGLAIAASLVVSLFAVHFGSSISERTDRTVREAAMNHNARLAVEFAATSLDELDRTMTRLPFELRRPDRLDGAWRTLGARYCSLAGHLAAHVQLVDPADTGSMSLFVTREASELERLVGLHRGVDGVDVELWSERGLFYAMARSAS